jgi:hypothetical protein
MHGHSNIKFARELDNMKEGVSSDAIFIRDIMKNCQFVGKL